MTMVPKNDWEETRLTLTSLSKTNEEIVKGNKILRQKLQNMTTRVKKREAEEQGVLTRNNQAAPMQHRDRIYTEGFGHENRGQPQADREVPTLPKEGT